MNLFINYLLQLFFTVGIIVIFGLIIALSRRLFCRIVGYNGIKILLATGAIGTPIHELSHALMCLIFGHKIIEVKLFQPESKDGTLGYVNHSYNSKNIYHQIGNFFIGVAPIICGSGVIILLMWLLVPEMSGDVFKAMQFTTISAESVLSLSTLTEVANVFLNVITTIFSVEHLNNIWWWIFIILALMISSHMELSTADIRGGFKGFIIIALLLFIVDLIIYFISLSVLESITLALATFALSIASFLTLSAVFSILMVVVALMIKGVRSIFRH